MATPALLSNQDNSNSGIHETASSTKKPVKQNYLFHIFLFFLTFMSTTMIGMRYMYNFNLGRPALASDEDLFPYVWVTHNWGLFKSGLPFSLTLLAILLTHEFGHYLACRYFGVKVTLPYMLPAPTLSGTCGAIIRLRSRIKSRSALIVIGAAGPIAGFLVALVTTSIGLIYSKPGTHLETLIQFQGPALVTLLEPILRHFYPHITPAGTMLPHPIFVASWIGLLITSLNLIPAGQLDGGHILYSLSPRAHQYSTTIMIATLIGMGFFCWIGWFLWAALLLWPGMRHPKVPTEVPISRGQFALAPICLVILGLTGSIKPFSVSLQIILGKWHWLQHMLHHVQA